MVASGLLFATASARMPPYTLEAIKDLKDVCCANAYVSGTYVEASNGDVLIDKPIFKQETGFLVEQLNRVGASFCCISRTRTIAKLIHPQIEGNFVTFSGGYTDLSSLGVSEFETYFILAFGEDLGPVMEAAKHIPDLDAHLAKGVSSSGMQALDMQKKGTNKESALASITEYYRVLWYRCVTNHSYRRQHHQ